MNVQGLRKAMLALGLFVVAASAHAQATRTWVSGVGDDANPCSRTAPCKTFAGAISKTAVKGIINVLDPGGFGGLTITKAITIDGGGIVGDILVSGTNGIIVNAGASDVVRIQNISLEGVGTGLSGVRFLAGGALYLDNVKIHEFSGQGVEFVPSGSSRLVITDSAITNNTGAGVRVTPGSSGFARVSIEHSRLYENGMGIKAEDRSVNSLRDTVISSNSNSGVNAFSASQAVEIVVDNCQVANNGVSNPSSAGIKAQGPMASVVISDNVVTGNNFGLSAAGGGDIFSFGSNRVVGNNTDGTTTGTLTTR
jgi:hypothetical protein